MKFEYNLDGLKMMVLDESHSAEVLEFYSRNRADFDIYEADKPDNYYTPKYISALLKAEYAALLNGRFGRFFLFSDDIPGRILGTVSFSGITQINLSCRIGYKIDKDFRRLGLGSIMVRRMLDILIYEKGMHRIEAYIHPENTPSVNLADKLGFISEGIAYSYIRLGGEWQDHLRFVYIS